MLTLRFLRRTLPFVAAAAALAIVSRSGNSRPAPQGGAVVQVRDFPNSSTIDIVAWDAMNPQWGLRTFVKRNNGQPDRYHRFWVNSDYPGGRDVSTAQGLNRTLQVNTQNDNQNCYNGKCTPTSTFGGRINDNWIRDAKGDVDVRFLTSSSSEINLSVKKGVVEAYLAALDSVSKSLKK